MMVRWQGALSGVPRTKDEGGSSGCYKYYGGENCLLLEVSTNIWDIESSSCDIKFGVKGPSRHVIPEFSRILMERYENQRM